MYAAPFPRPVSNLLPKANEKLLARPVRIIVTPIKTKATVITIRGPKRAARNPPMIAITRYPMKFPVPSNPSSV